jgi:hypothetical protein
MLNDELIKRIGELQVKLADIEAKVRQEHSHQDGKVINISIYMQLLNDLSQLKVSVSNFNFRMSKNILAKIDHNISGIERGYPHVKEHPSYADFRQLFDTVSEVVKKDEY